ncbi:MAG: alpha/beta fold hydrolase, partial [Cyanobacteria bacterium P01_C01_bin.72]
MSSITILETPHIYELTEPVADPKLPVLVFVHGWLLSRHYWQPLVELIKSDYQCLVYDARGFGESQANVSSSPSNVPLAQSASSEAEAPNIASYSLRAYAEDLGCLLASLSIDHAWVVGHSL